jgi:hypothetical protein
MRVGVDVPTISGAVQSTAFVFPEAFTAGSAELSRPGTNNFEGSYGIS